MELSHDQGEDLTLCTCSPAAFLWWFLHGEGEKVVSLNTLTWKDWGNVENEHFLLHICFMLKSKHKNSAGQGVFSLLLQTMDLPQPLKH